MIVPIMLAETTRRMRRAFSSSVTSALAIAGEPSRNVKLVIVSPRPVRRCLRALTRTILVVYYKYATRTTPRATAHRAGRRDRHPHDQQAGAAKRAWAATYRGTCQRARSRRSRPGDARHHPDRIGAGLLRR